MDKHEGPLPFFHSEHHSQIMDILQSQGYEFLGILRQDVDSMIFNAVLNDQRFEATTIHRLEGFVVLWGKPYARDTDRPPVDAHSAESRERAAKSVELETADVSDRETVEVDITKALPPEYHQNSLPEDISAEDIEWPHDLQALSSPIGSPPDKPADDPRIEINGHPVDTEGQAVIELKPERISNRPPPPNGNRRSNPPSAVV